MRLPVAFASLLLFLGSAPAGGALVLFAGDGTQQTTNPGAGLPWANVGSVGGGGGVYLGNFGGSYWVLSASHLTGSGASLSNLVLDSGTFNFVPGSGVNVRNGDNSATDLTLFRISAAGAGALALAGLPNLTLSTTAPTTGANVVMVGRGGTEGSGSLNFWAVTINPGASDDVWVNQGGTSAGANAEGYFVGGSVGKRWGQDTITAFASYNVGTGNTAAFYTTFDSGGGSPQGAGGDSGGATFYYNGSSWELTGILGAIATFENQPGSTAVVGDVTFSASIASYNSFITATAIPEPSAVTLGLGVLAGGATLVARQRKERGR